MTTPGGRGRFDGFDVLGQDEHWDEVTRAVVLRRLAPTGEVLRFFTEDEGEVVRALVDRLLGQDREREVPYVDVLPALDARLADGVTDGWRYGDMPHDAAAWRASVRGLESDADERFGSGFVAAGPVAQRAIVQGVQDGIDGEWRGMPARRVWGLWTRYACSIFYSHPWAWNEIGFGGPAYPRGYKALGVDRREPWERPERDAEDPVPWVRRTEAARKAHLDQLGTTPG